MIFKRKTTSFFLVFLLILSVLTACGNVPGDTSVSDDIAILYTNDIHTYIDGPLNYDVIAAIKQELAQQYSHVLLVDAGDHSQGTAYGSMDEGKTIIELMNTAGYDTATLGNHEFDYGIFGCMQLIDRAQFPYISCNFYNEADGVRGNNVLNSFVTFPCGDEVVAFVGITTPETLSSCTPAYFQNEQGEFIYGISGWADETALYVDVQKAIDDAQTAGATVVIALGHLGNEYVVPSWSSGAVIANTSGLDAFIDGHSHVVTEGQTMPDKDDNEVLLTQTGEYFSRIGMMVIDSDTGNITSGFIDCEEILAEDGETVTGYALKSELYNGTELPSAPEVKAIQDAWMAEIDTKLGQKIGSTPLTLNNFDGEIRLVRRQETNTGDFAADALYYLFDNMDMDVDIAITNGGSIRNQAITGDLTYKSCKEIHAFGNVACLQTVTGQQLLDALEWGSRAIGTEAELGAFLQVSGLTYEIDTSIPDTIQYDENNRWLSGPTGKYRVHNVQIYNRETQRYEPLDLNATYNLAGYNYTLRDLGDGFTMFTGAVNILDYVMEDYMVLAHYTEAFDNSVIEATNSPLLEKYPAMLLDYGTVSGSGRIVIR